MCSHYDLHMQGLILDVFECVSLAVFRVGSDISVSIGLPLNMRAQLLKHPNQRVQRKKMVRDIPGPMSSEQAWKQK